MKLDTKRLEELKKVKSFNFEVFKTSKEYLEYQFIINDLIRAIGLSKDNAFGYNDLSLLDKELLLKEIGIIPKD